MIEGKALELGALECHVVDAREEFAREYVAPAIKANALYGGDYPLFTALGRPADRQARGRARARQRLRHDRARLHRQGQRPGANRGDRRHARARAEGDRAGALLADGPRGGDRLRARARHPDQGRHGERRPTRSTTTSGGAPPRAAGSRISTTRPRTTSSSSSPGPSRRPRSPRRCEIEFERGVPVALDGERLELVELIERDGRDRRPPRRRDRRPHRGSHRRAEGPRHLRGARGGDPPARPPGARAARLHDPPEPVQAPARPPVGLPRLRRPVVGAAARRSRRLHGSRQRAGHGHDRAEALPGQRARRHALLARTPSTTRAWRRSRSPAACSPRRPRPGSSSCSRCSRAWPGACATVPEPGPLGAQRS